MSQENKDKCRILERYEDIAPYIQNVNDASDANDRTLGFFPGGVFGEFARRGDLYVLEAQDGSSSRYAGHLLFQRRFPRASVLQMLVLPEFRGQGYGKRLCERLISSLTRDGFLSINARVAEDLTTANTFWQSLDFFVQRTEAGGATTGRTIVVRVRELESPQLFPRRDVDPGNPLGLTHPPTIEVPLFLIDLNVLFDLSPTRARRAEAESLFKAERMNYCRLAISEELLTELQRTTIVGRPDPMANLARTFPTFPVATREDSLETFQQLRALVFPHRALEQLTDNETSDLLHLATAIEHDLAGLITNDNAILNAAGAIEANYGVQVLSPKAFILPDGSTRVVAAFETSRAELTLNPMSSADETDVRALLRRLEIPPSEVIAGWLPGHSDKKIATSCVIRNGSLLLGYVIWPALKQDGTTTVRAVVDESKEFSLKAARALVMHIVNLLVTGRPTSIRLRVPRNQSYLREIAAGFGFCAVRDHQDLVKLALGRVATRETWRDCQTELLELSDLRMEMELPTYRRFEQQIPFVTPTGERSYQSLEALETLLSPTLFCLPGRPAVTTPIKHMYSQPLLGHSRQSSLLPASSSNLFRERHFLSDPKTLKYFTRGTLMLFYESGHPRGDGELVAIARIRRSYLKSNEELGEADLIQSVLTSDTLASIGASPMRTVTAFDNVFPLPNPIGLSMLQRIGCGRPNDLITTRPISDTQLQAILAEAFKREQ